MVKVVLCGPPHSGKSCLRQGLKEALLQIPEAPYGYVLTACPDGEGSWYQETVNRDAVAAASYKAAYRGAYTPEFVRRMAESVKNCALPLAIIDIGGIADDKNEIICAGATHAILIAGARSSLSEWREFCGRVGLKIIAEVWSDYSGVSDSVGWDDGILIGSVHRLERGESVVDRPLIHALARYLVKLVGE